KYDTNDGMRTDSATYQGRATARTTKVNASQPRKRGAVACPVSRRYNHNGGTSSTTATGPFVRIASPQHKAANSHHPQRNRSPRTDSKPPNSDRLTNSVNNPSSTNSRLMPRKPGDRVSSIDAHHAVLSPIVRRPSR